jgi:aspartate/methionine/tyrosine aminotransferase
MFADRTNWNLAPNRLSEALTRHRAAGKPFIDLTVSNPTECGFAYDEKAILDALQNPAALKYEPDPKGLLVARQAIAEYYVERGESVSTDDVFVTTSTSEAYSWVLRLLCNAGDEVLIPSPGYPLFDFLADINDVKLVRYPLFYDHGWHFDMHALEQAIGPRTRAVIVVHPNNPTGNYCKPHETETLNRICAQRGLAIIADEVFLDFALDGGRRASFVGNGKVSGEPLTFTLSGLSKICGLPQMKVAWVAVSGQGTVRQEAVERLEVIADTYLSPNAPLQLATKALLATRHGFQRQVMERVRENLAEIDQAFDGSGSVSRLEADGGWCVVLRTSGVGWAEKGPVELLEQHGLLVYGGEFYYLDAAHNGFLVLSLLSPAQVFSSAVRVLANS